MSAEAERAVAAERRRIAREMHDVVAHSISLMVVQAGGARCICERDPERARAAAAEIESTGRDALREMRRLLGVMRCPDGHAERTPSPTLDCLEGLAARVRAAGMPVRLREDGTRRALAPGLELGAYRVVERALDALLRLTPDSPADVRIRWLPSALEVTVAGGAAGVPLPAAVACMRERCATYGGHLRTTRRPDGGHVLQVRFPLGENPDDEAAAAAEGLA